MSQFYDRMRATATKLLTTYKQGTVEIGRPVVTPGANPWDAPTTATDWTALNAVARGVSQALVDGTQVLASDLMILVAVSDYAYQVSDLIRLDGKQVAIVRVDQIPAAGDPVVIRFIVRA